MATRSSAVCPECGNTLWDIENWRGKAKCGNCRYERDFHRRERGEEQTPSQTKKMKWILSWFKNNRIYGSHELTYETTMQNGLLFAQIHTHDLWNLDDGVHVMIGRRGGVTVLSAYGPMKFEESNRRHLAKMLGGKVMK